MTRTIYATKYAAALTMMRLKMLGLRLKSAARLPIPAQIVLNGRSPRWAFSGLRVEAGPVWARVSLR